MRSEKVDDVQGVVIFQTGDTGETFMTLTPN